MRLFVALAIPAEVREKLAALIRTLREADPAPRWIDPRNLHVTLKFIGEVPPEKLNAICEALAAVHVAERCLTLEFGGLGFFPNARRPGVAWVGIRSSPCLALLAAEIDRTLATLEIPREQKEFTPHLTIARFKQTRVSAALAAEIESVQNRGFGTLSTSEFHLMESKLKSTGAEYTTLRSFVFSNEA